MKLETLVKKIRSIPENYTLDELIVIGLLISVLLSIYFTIAATVLIFGYLAMQNRIKTILTNVKGGYWAVAFCLLGFIVSIYNRNYSGFIIAIIMMAVFIIGMYVRMVMTRALFECMITISIYISVLCFLIAIIQQFTNTNTEYRAVSTFMNANYYAAFIEFIVLFCIYRLLKNPDTRQKVFLFSVIFVNILSLYLCDCRTAFIVLGFTVPVMLVLLKKYRAFFIIIGAAALGIALLLLLPDLFPRGDRLNSDWSKRISIWKTAIKGILSSPLFGQGGNTYALIFPKFGGHPAPHAHNIILDPILNYGIVGTVMLFMYLKANLASIYKMYINDKDQNRFGLSFAVILCVILHGLFDATIFGPQIGYLFVLFLGIAGIPENHTVLNKYSIHTLLTYRSSQDR